MERRWLAVLFLAATLNIARSETDVVRVLNRYEQIITSSILRWTTVDSGKELPEHAVVGAVPVSQEEGTEEANSYVCRLRIEGTWVSGRADASGCTAAVHGQVTKASHYEILENAEGGARLSWVRWDKYSQLLPGTITEDGVNYVARRTAPPGSKHSHFLGRLEPDGIRLTVVAEDKAEEYVDGEVLVETEAVSYEMTEIKFNRWRQRVTYQPLVLGEKQLSNFDEEDSSGPARVDAVIGYKYNGSISWGYGQAIITGLPVTAKLLNGTRLDDFKWGIDASGEREGVYAVEALLSPGTAVNVTLHGNYTDALVPYTAKITAVYADGERRSRQLNGSRRELSMRFVRPVFGPVYYLSNGSYVPTTTTSTTTSTSSTSTSTTSTTSRTTSSGPPLPLPEPPSTMERPTKKMPPERTSKGENSVMQNDEGTRASSTSYAERTLVASTFIILMSSAVLRVT